MTKYLFENLLKYLKNLLSDKDYHLINNLLLENLSWLWYSQLHCNKDYIEYIKQLNECLSFMNKKDYEQLKQYLEDQILYIDLSKDEEEY